MSSFRLIATVIIFSVLSVVAFGAFAFKSQKSVRSLIILAGQSNAQGLASVPDQMPPIPQDVPFWWDVPLIKSIGSIRWGSIGPQANGSSFSYIGPESGIALEFPGSNIAIMKFTLGGSGLTRDWRPGAEDGLLSRMFETMQTSAELSDEYLKPACLAFIQGESDAEDDTKTQNYEQMLPMLIKLIREEVGDNQLPVVLGLDEQHPWVIAKPGVLRTQENLARSDPHIVRASMIGLEKADTTHLTAAGSVEQGRRIARACVQAGMKI